MSILHQQPRPSDPGHGHRRVHHAPSDRAHRAAARHDAEALREAEEVVLPVATQRPWWVLPWKSRKIAGQPMENDGNIGKMMKIRGKNQGKMVIEWDLMGDYRGTSLQKDVQNPVGKKFSNRLRMVDFPHRTVSVP